MTLFFNLENLEKDSLPDSKKFLTLLERFYKKQIPKSKHDKYKSKLPLPGYNFLLNPDPLFRQDGIDNIFKVQYIILAGRRDYTLYKLKGVKSLDLSYYPDLDIDKVKNNPLLKIVGNQIYFKYEEI